MISWGILGTARIANRAVEAIQSADNCDVKIIGSRSVDRAKDFAKDHDITTYGTYEDVLEDEKVDAVYIPLPNHLHFTWAKQAITAGKHVLVDKPLVITTDEFDELVTLANARNVKLMEGFMYRLHPVVSKVKEILERGVIGSIELVSFTFAHDISGYLDGSDNYRYYRRMGGGSLFDLGSYGINLLQYLFEDRGELVSADLTPFQTVPSDDNEAADATAELQMRFGRIPARIVSSFEFISKHLWISGRRGEIGVDDITAPGVKTIRITTYSGEESIVEELQVPEFDSYQAQFEQFSQSVLVDTEAPIPLSSSRETLEVIEEAFALDTSK